MSNGRRPPEGWHPPDIATLRSLALAPRIFPRVLGCTRARLQNNVHSEVSYSSTTIRSDVLNVTRRKQKVTQNRIEKSANKTDVTKIKRLGLANIRQAEFRRVK